MDAQRIGKAEGSTPTDGGRLAEKLPLPAELHPGTICR